MTEIDFYILDGNQSETKLQFACKLVAKIYRLNRKVHIHTDSASESTQLDDLLWTYHEGSFLPHDVIGNVHTAKSPISIGHSEECGEINDVLVNLSDEVPLFFSRFLRLSEVVSSTASAKSLARHRYTFYKERGYPLKTHNLGQHG